MNKGERDYFICTNSMTGKCDLNSHFGQLSIRGKKLFSMFFSFTDGLNVSALLEENTNAKEIKTEVLKLEAKRNQIANRLQDFKTEVKTMILDGKIIPSTYNEVIAELESNRNHIDSEIDTRTKELDQIYISEKSFMGLKDIDVSGIIYDRTNEAIEKRVQYNNELKKIIKHIRIDFLNTSIEIEFANKLCRLVDSDGNVIDYEVDHVPEDFATIYNYDKDYINPDA